MDLAGDPAQQQGLLDYLAAQVPIGRIGQPDDVAKVPDFRFEGLKVWIDTPDKVFAEYSAEARVVATGRMYRQTYAGVLIAEGGRIELLREALDTAAAARAFSKD